MAALRHLSLRWRLVLAFLLVSALPVLIASYVAAQAISAVFQNNVERWLEETARFLAHEATEAEDEAEKSAGIIAAALASRGGVSSEEAIRPFADLLAAAGYDIVRIYDEAGATKYQSGSVVGLTEALPQEQRKWTFPVRFESGPGLAIGAVRPFEVDGRRHFVFVANVLDEKFFAVSQGIKALDIRVFAVDAAGSRTVAGGGRKEPFTIPPEALAKLVGGAESAVASASPDDELATAFAALRDDQRRLVGVIACRVSPEAGAFEQLSQWQLFAALALLAGLVSTAVGFFLAERISRPVRSLTGGLRAVAAGDYRARVAEEGGRELEELAAGFNAMTEQLERLRAMESSMRRREQLAALGEAAAVIAHEIRNPLGIIKTSSQVVRMKSALKPSEDRLVGFVLEEVARIDRLVQDILDYARPRETQKDRLDLTRDVLARAVEVAGPELERHEISRAIIGRDTRAPVLGDRDLLYQAVLNLVLNAIDAMPGGGRLTIEIAREREAVEVAIEDDGPGIPPEIKDRIFDPFFTTKAKGTGLGLAKTKAIVEEHGGTLSCRSEPGRGAVFVLRLPLLQPEEAHAAADLDR